MKIFANITAYNEETFLDYVIASIHDYVDYICIIDGAMENVVANGGQPHSTDGSVEIIKKWQQSKKVHYIKPKTPPKNFIELGNYGLNLAKELKCDWFFSVGADEIWPENCIKPMRKFLIRCENNGIMGVNVHMYAFAPDFYHWYPFYVPRIGKITNDCHMPFHSCDILYWPKLNAWQTIEPLKVPKHVRKVNMDYPYGLKVFHYTCCAKEKTINKYKFYQTYANNIGSEHLIQYVNKNWDYFKNIMKCKEFKGKHPEIMQRHPLAKEKLY